MRFPFFTPLSLLSMAVLLLALPQCKTEKKPSVNANWKRTSNEMLIRLASEPSGLNPILSITDQYASQIMRHLYLPLMTIDPESFQLEPCLIADEPGVVPIADGPWKGGLRYDFEIRKEAVWDNGTPVTGHDYVFALKTVFNPKVPAQRVRPYLELIKDVQVDAANPKKFSVFTQDAYILALESIGNSVPPMPAYLYDPEGTMANIQLADLLDPAKVAALENDPGLRAFADRFTSERYSRDTASVAGCGPYALESIGDDQRVTLVKKKNWWGEKISDPPSSLQAYPEKMIYWPVRDQASAMTLIKSEDMDIAITLDAKDFLDAKALPTVEEDYNFFTPATFAYYFIYVNTKAPKLSDKLVRKALAHLLNVEEIIETVFYGLGERVNGPVLPMKDYYNKELPLIPYNIESARILLSEAGWTDSNNNGTVDKMVNGERTEMKLTYLITNVPAQEKIAAIFKDAASQAGIELEIISKEFQAQKADLNTRSYELASGALVTAPVLDDFYQIWHTDSDTPDGTNRTGFGNAQSDELIETIRQTIDKKERDRLYQTFQKMVYEEQPMLFMLTPQARVIIHKRFEAFSSPVNPGFFPNQYELVESLR